MTVNEVQRLLNVAPPDRRILYQVALTTGLRAGELRALKMCDLNQDFKGLNLRAEWTKSRKAGIQPLSVWLYDLLKESSQGKTPDDPLLNIPSHLAREMDKDLESAGIRKWTPAGKLDFHAFRVAYVSFILEAGASAKEAQTSARHSTLSLTLDTYARASYKRLAELADRVAKDTIFLDFPITSPQRQIIGMKSGLDSDGYVVEDRGFEPPPSAMRMLRSPN
jgi:integrase